MAKKDILHFQMYMSLCKFFFETLNLIKKDSLYHFFKKFFRRERYFVEFAHEPPKIWKIHPQKFHSRSGRLGGARCNRSYCRNPRVSQMSEKNKNTSEACRASLPSCGGLSFWFFFGIIGGPIT